MPEVGSLLLTYDAYRAIARDGDVYIWHGRPRKFLHLAIQDAQASRFIHAAMGGWCYDFRGDYKRLLLGEFSRGGSRLTIASSQFAPHPKEWSVFRPHLANDLARRIAWNTMIDLSGTRYNNRVIVANWLRSLPVLRWMFGTQADENDASTWGRHTCSTSVAYCLRNAGLDPVLHCADWRTTPALLVQSPALEYIGTIV